MDRALPLEMRAGPELDCELIVLAPHRTAGGGGCGWRGSHRTLVDVDGELVDCRVSVIVTAVGSADWPYGERPPDPGIDQLMARMYGPEFQRRDARE